MYSVHEVVQIDAFQDRFRGISDFRDFGRTVQSWTHFSDIFSWFGCAARTARR